MKQNKNIFPSLSIAAALLIATMFASCTKAELEAPVVKQDAEISFGLSGWNTPSKIATKGFAQSESKVLVKHNPDDPGSLGLSVTVVDGIDVPKSQIPVTKGHHITDIEEFDVASYYYTQSPSFDANYIPWQEYNNGFSNGKSYFWPSTGSMYFVARYPSKVDENNETVFSEDISPNNDGNLQFSYTIPASVVNQRDIMAAVEHVADNNAHAGTPVNLKFQHLLAAVQFKVGDMQFIKINSLKIIGVIGGDIIFIYDENKGNWVASGGSTTTYDLTSIIPDTSAMIEGDEITNNKTNSLLFVTPQSLPSGAAIEVDYTETITQLSYKKQAKISGEWIAGKTTIYSFNIQGTDFGTVEIPRPEDQDAHYIMMTMNYNMGNLLNVDKIESVTATAQWINDESGSTKSGISLKFEDELSPTQIKGYWTDKRYTQTITVSSSGQTPSEIKEDNTTDSHGNKGLRGGPSLNITNSSKDIVLFIEENNGTKDREGELIFTAKLTSGTNIVLGRGTFKQLCPSWNQGIGIERYEEDATYPYGFKYTRTVVYTNPEPYDELGLWGRIEAILRALFLGSSVDVALPDLSQAAGGFVIPIYREVDVPFVGKIDYLESITLDYSALNDIQNEANGSGKDNTIALYEFTGSTDIAELEKDLDAVIASWKGNTTDLEDNPEEYAAFIALTRNRMCELQVTIKEGSDTKIQYKPLLYRNAGYEVEWFLPSSEEALLLRENGTSTDSATSPLTGEYWSSTAGDDSQAYSHSFTFNNNTCTINTQKGRLEYLKVRAARMQP